MCQEVLRMCLDRDCKFVFLIVFLFFSRFPFFLLLFLVFVIKCGDSVVYINELG